VKRDDGNVKGGQKGGESGGQEAQETDEGAK